MKTISFENLKGLKKRNSGLTSQEVAEQLGRFGPNNIEGPKVNFWIDLIQDTLKDPMIWFLLGIGALFLFTNQMSDGLTLILAVLPLILMDAFLHWRTKNQLTPLKGQLNSKVIVLRDEVEKEINSLDVVPGDIILVHPGLLLPVDGIFLRTEKLQIDESAMTGESVPITKGQTLIDPFDLVDQGEVKIPAEHLGQAGTRVLTGTGDLLVLLTGLKTSYGEIVQSVINMPHQQTPLQKSMGTLVRSLIYFALGFCLLLILIRLYQGFSWIDALLSGATLAVAAIPEEFPVVFTFFLGVGIYRLAKNKVLVRKAVSVENIGRITQICTDKTGTLTLGKLQLAHLDPVEGIGIDANDANKSEQDLLKGSLACSSSSLDPLDLAIRESALKMNLIEPKREMIFPFTEDRKRESVIVRETLNSHDSFVCYTKGAPELILSLTNLSQNQQQREFWQRKIKGWAEQGHKVIGVAKKSMGTSSGTFDKATEPSENLEFCGLLALEDPVRPQIPQALMYCHQRQIKVLMITGDHPDTAMAIARDAGFLSQRTLTLDDKFDFELALAQKPSLFSELDVVARSGPLQKLKIVKILQASGEVVAVTGDGVNDVPALKAADIGIAMGERGTQSAKEISSIILMDDNFISITRAIEEGKQLFKNLQQSFEYLLLIHIPLVLVQSIIPLAGFELPFLPIHIVWLELIIHPTATLAFQAKFSKFTKSKKDLQNPSAQLPTGSFKGFFSQNDKVRIGVLGLLMSLFLVGFIYYSTIVGKTPLPKLRAEVFMILTLWSGLVTLFLTRLKSLVAIVIVLFTVIMTLGLIQYSNVFTYFHLNPIF